MKPLVIYHGPTCWDGFCAAWIWHRYGEEADYHPGVYGQEPPDVSNRKNVYVFDFSYPRATLERMREQCKSLIVLDHHKTARADLEGLSWARFDMDLSGAQLTWDFMQECGYVSGDYPWLVQYTADRDLWRWKLPDSKAINAYIRSWPLDFEIWDRIHESDSWPVFEGEVILRAEEIMVNDHVARAIEIEMDGHKVLSVNATVLFSEIAGRLAETRPFGVAWFIRQDGKRRYSLRSRDDGVDVSEIAKAHGGGGHRNAAGFEESV